MNMNNKKVIDYFLQNETKVKSYFNLSVILLVIVYCGFRRLEIRDMLPVIFVVWSILNPWPSHQYAKVGTMFLLTIPIFIVLRETDYAEVVAIYAYILLIMTVLRAVIESRLSPKSD